MPDTGSPRRTPHLPTADVAGRPAAEVAGLYRAEGFEVQVVDLDRNPVVDAVFITNRIRLAVRDGIVVRASQG